MPFYHGGHLTKDLYGAVSSVLNVGGIKWLLLDRYSTDRAAGAVNGTLSEPSGHTRTLTDTAPNAVITGGQFKVTATTGTRDPWLRYTDGWARVAGRMLRGDVLSSGIAANNAPTFGLSSTLTTPLSSHVAGINYNSTLGIWASMPGTQIMAYTANMQTYIIILRSTGHYVLVDGKLRWIHRTGSDATLYPVYWMFYADASQDSRADNLGIADLPLTNPTLYPTPTLSDSFSDTVAPLVSDGLAHVEADGNGAGLTWSGVGTFSNLGNKAYISPTLGTELLTNGDFSAWTGDNPDGWGISGEAGVSEISEVGTGEGHGGIGTGMANIYRADANVPAMTQTVLTIGQFYRFTLDINTVISGSTYLGSSTAPLLLYNSTGTKTLTGRTTSTNVLIGLPANPSDITVDNASAKLLTFTDCLRHISPASAGEPYLSAKLTITANTQAGFVINLDDGTTPTACIHIWCNRVDNKIYARPMAAGAWGADTLAGVSFTYSAGAYLEVRRIGNEMYVFYNDAYIGTWTTAVPTTGTKIALFATDSASYFENVTVYPTGGYDYSRYA